MEVRAPFLARRRTPGAEQRKYRQGARVSTSRRVLNGSGRAAGVASKDLSGHITQTLPWARIAWKSSCRGDRCHDRRGSDLDTQHLFSQSRLNDLPQHLAQRRELPFPATPSQPNDRQPLGIERDTHDVRRQGRSERHGNTRATGGAAHPFGTAGGSRQPAERDETGATRSPRSCPIAHRGTIHRAVVRLKPQAYCHRDARHSSRMSSSARCRSGFSSRLTTSHESRTSGGSSSAVLSSGSEVWDR